MRINITHTTKVQAALDEAQAGARARVYDLDALADGITALDRKLSALPAKYHKGVKAYLADWDAGSKRHPNQGTVITVERGATTWFITGIKRHYRPATSPRILSRGGDFDSVARHHGFIIENEHSLARI